ncbi:MAG: penicillin-binding protein 2 [bacterium]
MSELFPLGRTIDSVSRKYAEAPNDLPLDSEHQMFIGNSLSRRQKIGVLLLCFAVAMIFSVRVAELQLVLGKEYRNLAEGNRLRTIPKPAKRGLITDSQGVILAENIPSFYLSVVPEYLPTNASEREKELMVIADASGITPSEIEDELLIAGRDISEPVLIHAELTKDVALKAMIELRDVRSARISIGSRRSYPESINTPSLAHLLGYEGKLNPADLQSALAKGYLRSDLMGRTGLESSYESQLRGTYGKQKVEVDVRGNIERIIGSEAKVDGETMRLSIDMRLQATAEKALRAEFKKSNTSRGVVIAMDPRNGKILAMVSLPSFDNNLFGSGIPKIEYEKLTSDPNQPLFNRAISGEYPSGSTLKIVYAGAALAEGVITESTTVSSTGGIRVGEWFFPDWKPQGHGVVNVRQAIAWSVNTFFYEIAGGLDNFRGLGIYKMGEWVKKFGLDEKLGIDIPGERPGFFPTPEWKQEATKEPWYIGDTYHVGIGQGTVLVTPLQVAAYTSVYANGGKLFTPTLISSFRSPEMPERETSPNLIRENILSAKNIGIISKGMREAVIYGSARSLKTLPVEVAGKTGTAQFQSNKNPHAWFTGFAPYENPQIVVTVLVEEGVEGSTAAVPIARAMFETWNEIQTGKQ